ncbi:Vms1/Ankzf1 family peptidyl-tRNA hydrolase [Halomarina rubra]|uniref:Vms1/Ankzf1 family peptidyl-tRNA hydrolase n=1 Tax=Halomarina rubra TaxID=2071873 RepID=A0ABD6AQ28_9EURY|nr:Vms1/Ankzf1 family peptidyl-tRNA hydrolase [Halomarina rubra]
MSTESPPLHDRIGAVERVAVDDERLLTIAVPADESVASVHERVEEDHAEASYIDTDDATSHERDALEHARRVLADYETTPDNGLVVFAGVVDDAATDWTFDALPDPVTESRYAWANEFDTSPLDAVVGPSNSVGLLVVDRGGAALGRLDDGRLDVLEEFDSDVMGKTRAGGQSAERFERERERQRDEFFDRVGETAERAFRDRTAAERATDGDGAVDGVEDEEGGVEGVLVGGTTGTVERFVEDGHLSSRLVDAMLGDPFAVEYANERGLERLAELGRDRIAAVERRGPRETLEDLFSAAADEDRVAYGREGVAEALTYDAVETLVLADSLRTEAFRALESQATDQGGEVVVVPADVEGGDRFREGFGGRAAFLRFPIE